MRKDRDLNEKEIIQLGLLSRTWLDSTNLIPE